MTLRTQIEEESWEKEFWLETNEDREFITGRIHQLLAQERAKVLAEVREKVEKMLQHYIKGSYYDEAINNVLSLLKDLQVKE